MNKVLAKHVALLPLDVEDITPATVQPMIKFLKPLLGFAILGRQEYRSAVHTFYSVCTIEPTYGRDMASILKDFSSSTQNKLMHMCSSKQGKVLAAFAARREMYVAIDDIAKHTLHELNVEAGNSLF